MLALLRPRSPLPPTAAAATTTDALDDALRSFQDSLDPEQKTKFLIIKAVPDAHAVAEFTHQLDQENAKRQSRCVSARISPLLESIQQFSGIVETFVSSHPQIAALNWGSIKLVLQVSELPATLKQMSCRSASDRFLFNTAVKAAHHTIAEMPLKSLIFDFL